MKRNTNMRAVLAALLAGAVPARVEAGEQPVKNFLPGTFVRSVNPNDPTQTAIAYVIGEGDQPNSHFVFLSIRENDEVKVEHFETRARVIRNEVWTEVVGDEMLAEKVKKEAGRMRTLRALCPANFDQSEIAKFMATRLEELHIGDEFVRRDLPAVPLGRFFNATVNDVTRLCFVIGVSLRPAEDSTHDTYKVLVTYRSDEPSKPCTCGKIHDDPKSGTKITNFSVRDLSETSEIDEILRTESMEAIGDDLKLRRNAPEYRMLKDLGAVSGLSDFCEGFPFADECLAVFTAKQTKQTEAQAATDDAFDGDDLESTFENDFPDDE